MSLHRRSLQILAVLVAATLAGAGFASAGAQDQPAQATYRGNAALTGEQPGPAPQGEPTLLWRFETGGKVKSAPAVAEGGVYFGSMDGNIYAVDAKSGQERWRFRVPTGIPVRSSPAVSDGVVFVGDDRNYLYALDAETGQELWRFKTGQMAASTVVDGGSSTSPGTTSTCTRSTWRRGWKSGTSR